MQYFKELGCNTVGLDLGVDAIGYGQKVYGLNLINIDLPDFNTDIKFDLVIYNSVFEHISNISSHMNKLNNLLKEDGILFLRVPGIKNLHNNSFHRFDLLNFITLPHIYYFSARTLTNLMNKYSFECIKSNEVIFSLFKKSNSNIDNAVVNDYSEVMSYIRRQDNSFKLKAKNALFLLKKRIRNILDYLGLLSAVKKVLGK